MIKLLLLLSIIILLSGCQKDVIGNCGIVVGGNREVALTGFYPYKYYLSVRFGNKVKQVYVDEVTYRSYVLNQVICF